MTKPDTSGSCKETHANQILSDVERKNTVNQL